MVLDDRFPYGNALLVETSISAFGRAAELAALAPDWGSFYQDPALTCPDNQGALLDFAGGYPSLYLLYAHLQNMTRFTPGERVSCGQEVGIVGSSGNSLNPHLHLEARLGPPGARFPSMAHYDSSATPAEMAAYCTWRVQGDFLPLDPLGLVTTLGK